MISISCFEISGSRDLNFLLNIRSHPVAQFQFLLENVLTVLHVISIYLRDFLITDFHRDRPTNMVYPLILIPIQIKTQILLKILICLLPESPVATWVRLQIPVVSPPGLGGRSPSSLQTYSGLGLDSISPG